MDARLLDILVCPLCKGPLEYDKWWQALKSGRCFVTNGPLLRCTANGQLPGHVFKIASDKPLEIKLDLNLTYQDPVPRIEIIANGQVAKSIDLNDAPSPHRRAVTLSFTESGWFLIRAVAANPNTFRFASTAPFYIEIANRPQKISRKSAQFFLGWSQERSAMLEKALPQNESSRQVLAEHETAIQFWRNKLSSANAE